MTVEEIEMQDEQKYQKERDADRLWSLKNAQLVYRGKVYDLPFDREPIPAHYRIVGLDWFSELRLRNDEYLPHWEKDYRNFLGSIPTQHVSILLEKGIEYAQLLLSFHIDHETKRPQIIRSWERRIKVAQNIQEEFKTSSSVTNTTHSLINSRPVNNDSLMVAAQQHQVKINTVQNPKLNYQSLGEVFKSQNYFTKAVFALQHLQIIDEANNNLIGNSCKGIIRVWHDIITTTRNQLQPISDTELTVLINKHFRGAGISENSDGKHFRNPINKTADKKYRTKLLALM